MSKPALAAILTLVLVALVALGFRTLWDAAGDWGKALLTVAVLPLMLIYIPIYEGLRKFLDEI